MEAPESKAYRYFYGSPGWLLRQLSAYRPAGRGGWLLAFGYLLRSCMLIPGMWYERLFRARRIRASRISAQPLFLLGHYRCGTTLLHKLLAANPEWVYPELMDFFFPFFSPRLHAWLFPWVKKALALLHVRNPYFHQYDLRMEDPVEEDLHFAFAVSPVSTYWGFVFSGSAREWLNRTIAFRDEAVRKRWQAGYFYGIQRLSYRKKGKMLVLKSPPSMGRVGALLELFPEARFVYISRKPVDVFRSMEKMANQVIVRQFSVQGLDKDAIREMVLDHYLTLFRAYQAEKGTIPEGRLIEIRYDELMQSPLETIQKVFTTLGLGDWEAYLPHLEAALSKEKAYQPDQNPVPAELEALVKSRLPEIVAEWEAI